MIGRPLGLLAAGTLAAGGGLLTLDAPAAAPVMSGAALFQAKGCATCHTGPDSTSAFGVGPELDDVAVSAVDRIAGLELEDYVRMSIVDPSAFVAEGSYTGMPTLPVTTEELDALVTYLLAR